MISLALPKGSALERPVLGLLTAAGIGVRRASGRSYRASVDYGGPIQVVFLKPREIPPALEKGAFDFGVAGTDWIEETGAKVEIVEPVAAGEPWRLVLAVPDGGPGGLPPGARVATEFPDIGRQYLRGRGLAAEVVHSYGASQAKIPELADAVIEVLEPGVSLPPGLRVLDTVRTCAPRLVAGPHAWRDARKRARIQRVARLLDSVRAGAAHVLLTVRTSARELPRVAPALPPRSWRVGDVREDGLVVVQGLAARHGVAETIDGILAAGAADVVASPVGRVATRQPAPPSQKPTGREADQAVTHQPAPPPREPTGREAVRVVTHQPDSPPREPTGRGVNPSAPLRRESPPAVRPSGL
ncbi:ATP phosphoribosyltransferase [Streptosporangium sp. NPDC002721]|uniref:ATP phosphoribosyltransferase n=1 Tax=Streptosporangium sp. NPDC002721 TaxID=3366188 RepID=UPI0036C4090A